MSNWFLVNACVSNNNENRIIGPLQGIKSGSSATNIRNQNEDGAQIISLKLAELLNGEEFSLIKIDIEGAEELILKDLRILSNRNTAIWLSLHPPHFTDKKEFVKQLFALEDDFIFVDSDNKALSMNVISRQILSDDAQPEWGTEWGNLFEIGLLPNKYFFLNGDSFSRKHSAYENKVNTAA